MDNSPQTNQRVFGCVSDLSHALLPVLATQFVAASVNGWQSRLGYLRVDDHLQLVWGRQASLSGIFMPRKSHVFTIFQGDAPIYYNGRSVSPTETPLLVMVSEMGKPCDLSIAQSSRQISLLVDPVHFSFLYETLLDHPIEAFLEKPIVQFKSLAVKENFLDLMRPFLTNEVSVSGGSSRGSTGSAEILESFILALAPEEAPGELSYCRNIALKAHSQIIATPDRKMSITEICETLDASSRSLQHGFKELYGIGFIEYHRISRYHRLRKHIRKNGLQLGELTDLMGAFGFEHTGRFSVGYKKLFGVSPSLDQKREEDPSPLIPDV